MARDRYTVKRDGAPVIGQPQNMAMQRTRSAPWLTAVGAALAADRHCCTGDSENEARYHRFEVTVP
jgi:hypothetical protein